jgi:putative CocE/NonD family hydrolase
MAINRREFVIGSVVTLPAVLAGAEAPVQSHTAQKRTWSLPAKRPVRIVENQFITMADGTRLAVKLWLPDPGVQERVPVVLEYIPYRKSDGTYWEDEPHGDYLAGHGIAFARVDIRGTGESLGGLLRSEYTPEEQADGVAVIKWLAQQEWCNGSVGMRGYSWGGFNSLQIAALAPPALKAIMPMCFADNRYTDDAHYVGGALGLVNFEWGTMFQSVLAAPPDPRFAGNEWKQEWLRRLEGMPPILAEWLEHQRFDDYWKRASVGLHYERIRCPVYCVGGWVDSYNNSIPRALERLQVPRKALIGSWGHFNPDQGTPGPALDWAHEEVRWWEQWLKGMDTGIMEEPMFRFYMPTATPSETYPRDTPGRWVAEELWPASTVNHVLHLGEGSLHPDPAPASRLRYRADRIVGLSRPEWVPFDMRSDLPGEQSQDDELSLCFDSSPLSDGLEILGRPTVFLVLSADVPVAKVAVRLNEVTSDGRSWIVTYGVLNLTHRDGHEHPKPLEPGVDYTVELPLNFIAHRFKPGSRIRLAVSESLWPLVWPSPQLATLSLDTANSRLALPVRPPRADEPPFHVPLLRDRATGGWGEGKVRVTGPDADGRIVIDKTWPGEPRVVPGSGVTKSEGWNSWRMEVSERNPAAGVWSGDYVQRFERKDWGRNEIRGAFELRSTASTFELRESIHATHDGETVFERTWQRSIARDLM